MTPQGDFEGLKGMKKNFPNKNRFRV